LRRARCKSCAIVDRRKPFPLGEIVDGVGVEERIKRLGRAMCDYVGKLPNLSRGKGSVTDRS